MRIKNLIFAIAVSTFLFTSGTEEASAQTASTICDGKVATIVGTEGADVLTGTQGPDVIAGLQGDDIIIGLGGDDIICGGKGDDTISGGTGFDIIYGAQGNDIIYAANGGRPTDRVDTRGSRMFGGAGDDQIHGSSKWDRMQGGPGKDIMFGYEGRDWMRAGPDADGLDGGPGVDDMHGGNGTDFLKVGAGDIVRGGAGLDQCNIDGEPDVLRSCGRNELEKPAPRPVVRPVKGIQCEAQVNSIGSIECVAWLVNTTNETARVSTQVAFYNASGVRIDSETRFQSYVDPGESYLQTFFGPAETVRMEVLGMSTRLEPRVLQGAPVPQRFSDDLFLPIDESVVSVGPIEDSVLEDTRTMEIRVLNIGNASGSISTRVAFYAGDGVRIDSDGRIEREVSPGEIVTLKHFTEGDAVSYRILEIEFRPS